MVRFDGNAGRPRLVIRPPEVSLRSDRALETGSRPPAAESVEQELAFEQVLHIGASSALRTRITRRLLQIRKTTSRSQYAMPDRIVQPSVLLAASMCGLVLTPVSVLFGALGLWRVGADVGWTSHFFIAGGLFSRYQFWIAAAIGAHGSALLVNRWVANRSADLPELAP